MHHYMMFSFTAWNTDHLCFWTHSFQTLSAGLSVPNCAQCIVKEFKFKTPTYGAGVWI
jgi:hypothetical protein